MESIQVCIYTISLHPQTGLILQLLWPRGSTSTCLLKPHEIPSYRSISQSCPCPPEWPHRLEVSLHPWLGVTCKPAKSVLISLSVSLMKILNWSKYVSPERFHWSPMSIRTLSCWPWPFNQFLIPWIVHPSNLSPIQTGGACPRFYRSPDKWHLQPLPWSATETRRVHRGKYHGISLVWCSSWASFFIQALILVSLYPVQIKFIVVFQPSWNYCLAAITVYISFLKYAE